MFFSIGAWTFIVRFIELSVSNLIMSLVAYLCILSRESWLTTELLASIITQPYDLSGELLSCR